MRTLRGLVAVVMMVVFVPVAALGFLWRATSEAWQWGQLTFEDVMDWINNN